VARDDVRDGRGGRARREPQAQRLDQGEGRAARSSRL
jgi:hypothetical protein